MKSRNYMTGKNILLIISLIHLGMYLTLGLFPNAFADSRGEMRESSGALVPFHASDIHLNALFQAPSWDLKEHFFGTDNLGRDVLAGIILGCQTSLFVALPAMLIAFLIGTTLGLLAGYFGNQQVKSSYTALLFYGTAFLLSMYYGFYLNQIRLQEAFAKNFQGGLIQLLYNVAIVILLMTFASLLFRLLKKALKIKDSIYIPIDESVLKTTEILVSIPNIILIISLTAFVRPSLGVFVLIIGFTSWTGIARLVRGEILKVKGLQYVEAARALGLKKVAILFKHILPNAIAPAIVAFTFGLANVLALEATLSFLGIGLPPDFVSWGKIIAGVRHNLSAWWLVVFPGLYLSLTVLALHNISNYFLDRFGRD